MRRRFRDSDVSGNNGIVNLFAKELANVVFNHLSQIVALVVHGQDNAVQRQLGIKLLLNLIDIANQISAFLRANSRLSILTSSTSAPAKSGEEGTREKLGISVQTIASDNLQSPTKTS